MGLRCASLDTDDDEDSDTMSGLREHVTRQALSWRRPSNNEDSGGAFAR
jgi:hypothetical protein